MNALNMSLSARPQDWKILWLWQTVTATFFLLITGEKAIDKAYFIYIANQEAADALEKLFDEYNFDFPACDAQEMVLYPASFAYKNNGMYWKSLQDIENEYNELLAIKDEMQDCLLNKKYW